MRQTIEFVARSRDPQPTVEIAGHDGAGGLGHVVDALENATSDEPAAGAAEHADEEQRITERPPDDVAQARTFLHVPPDHEAEPARKEMYTRTSAWLGRRIGLVSPCIGGLELSGLIDDASRQSSDISRDPLPDRRGDEVEGGAGRTRATFHDGDETA